MKTIGYLKDISRSVEEIKANAEVNCASGVAYHKNYLEELEQTAKRERDQWQTVLDAVRAAQGEVLFIDAK